MDICIRRGDITEILLKTPLTLYKNQTAEKKKTLKCFFCVAVCASF